MTHALALTLTRDIRSTCFELGGVACAAAQDVVVGWPETLPVAHSSAVGAALGARDTARGPGAPGRPVGRLCNRHRIRHIDQLALLSCHVRRSSTHTQNTTYVNPVYM